jgi:DNA-binding response OmpR family regulator
MTSGRRSALVIDDDADLSALLSVLLEDRGFTVDVKPDGIHATELSRSYDIILLDLNMPVFDGERLVEYWSMTQPDVLERVIVLSGYSRFTRGRALPTFGTLQKPFDFSALNALIDACLLSNK